MTVYGIGLGPGDAELVTVAGRKRLNEATAVYTPGPHSRAIVSQFVDAESLHEVEFPMTRDQEQLRAAWKSAAEEIATVAATDPVAFVTLGDPHVYSTFRHLRWALAEFHPTIEVTVVPGISMLSAFLTAFDTELETGAELMLREANGAETAVGPDRLLLFKVLDAPALHDRLTEAGYTVTYGRRLFMDDTTVVTTDPADVADRDYFTIAYATRPTAASASASDRPSLLADRQ